MVGGVMRQDNLQYIELMAIFGGAAKPAAAKVEPYCEYPNQISHKPEKMTFSEFQKSMSNIDPSHTDYTVEEFQMICSQKTDGKFFTGEEPAAEAKS